MTKPWEREWAQPQAPQGAPQKPWERTWATTPPAAPVSPSVATPDPAEAAAAGMMDPGLVEAQAIQADPNAGKKFVDTGGDVLRLMEHGATFGWSDEIAARMRSIFGADFDKALAEERAALAAAREKAGPASMFFEGAGGVLLPGGPLMQLIQRAAGPGASVARTALVAAPIGAATSTAAATGEREDNSVIGAATDNYGLAPALGAVAPGAAALGQKTVQFMGKAVGEGANLAAELGHRVRGEIPGAYTTRRATQHLADFAEEGGMRSAADLQRGLGEFAVPNTPSTLLNAGNDRVVAGGLEAARKLKTTHIPRMENGVRVEDDVFAAMQRNQRMTENDLSQADDLRHRLFQQFGVAGARRDPVDELVRLLRNIEGEGAALETMQLGNTRIPGLVDLLGSSAETRRLHRGAARNLSIPGPGAVPEPQVPMLPAMYQRQLERWQARQQAAQNAGVPFNEPPPVLLQDNAIPLRYFQTLRRSASDLSQANRPGAQEAGTRVHGAVRDLVTALNPRSNARRVDTRLQNIHGMRNEMEDRAAGRALASASPQARDDALAAFETQPSLVRQENTRQGYIIGLADQIEENAANLASLRGKFLQNGGDRRTFDRLQHAQPGPDRDELWRQIRNVAEMQEVGRGMSQTAATRARDISSVPAEAAKVWTRYQFTPSVAYADMLRNVAAPTEMQRREIVRLLTDTNGEGVQLLSEELNRRFAKRTNLPPATREMFVNALINQLMIENNEGAP